MVRWLRALASWTGIVILLALVACGQRATTPVAETTPGIDVRFGSLGTHTTPPHAPTIDVAAKNLTATAYRPPTTTIVASQGPLHPGRPSHGGPIVDHVSFVDKLRGKRCTVDPSGSVWQPFLRGEGIVLRVSDCTVAQPVELQSF